jgi:hypothetical protein
VKKNGMAIKKARKPGMKVIVNGINHANFSGSTNNDEHIQYNPKTK